MATIKGFKLANRFYEDGVDDLYEFKDISIEYEDEYKNAIQELARNPDVKLVSFLIPNEETLGTLGYKMYLEEKKKNEEFKKRCMKAAKKGWETRRKKV
jgi:hypothetical protein